ncbi:alpha/beta hydrolase [Allobranchiibius huperziae]|uniref:Enterochelin esterase-like enzyme n=1 Tax=Allobranchiibius huperziae TaxID=1874116 RepID=A0A853DGM0_9MICO|nr:alpha/beta hydrolase-fold protein [Allobranchiibius huperziae]NYJ75938.1 enterochelin esterase-like enzyme [Allobranchiibius huperziae]
MLEPNSVALVVLLWVSFAAAVVAVVVLWPRLARRRPLALLGRLGTQVGASALVVLAAAATLNQQNGWYGTWSDLGRDLMGTPPSVQRVAVKGDLQTAGQYSASAAAEADLRAQRLFGPERAVFARDAKLHVAPGPHGQWLHVVIPGLGKAAGRGAGKAMIWLPPAYVDGPSQATYPVIEAYAGIPGSPADYQKRMGLQNIIVRAHQKSGLIEPVVVVPDYTPSGIDTECTNSGGIDMETWLTKTVPAWTVRHLRVRPDKESWAVMGFSAGGFCAEVSAFLHPQQYGSVMLFGTYNNPSWGNWTPYGRRSIWPARYSMLNVVRQTPPPVDVWIEVSEGDRFAGPPSRSLINAAHGRMSVTSVYLPGAGHRFDVWQAVMPVALEWLGHAEPGFHGVIGDGVTHGTPRARSDDRVVLRGRKEDARPA